MEKAQRVEQYTRVLDEANGSRVALDYMNDELVELFKTAPFTVDELIRIRCKKFASNPLFGFHDQPDEPFEWMTYGDLLPVVQNIGTGLCQEVGLELGSKACIGVYARTCLEWHLIQCTLVMYGWTSVPLYDTLGRIAMSHISKLTELDGVFCFDARKAFTLLSTLLADADYAREKLPKYLVLFREDEKALEELKQLLAENQLDESVKVKYLKDVQAAGQSIQIKTSFAEPGQDDVFLINFTSGTTGIPKGVCVTHRMMIKMVKNFYTDSQCKFPKFQDNDVYFSFLPMAHILEQSVLVMTIFSGASMGIYAGRIDKLLDELKMLRPTTVILVPRLLGRIYERVYAKLSENKLMLRLFNYAMRTKTERLMAGNREDSLLHKLLFCKIRQMLGGRLRICTTGSASCAKEIIEFSRNTFGADFFVAYGATETCGPIAVTMNDHIDDSSVGIPIPFCQMKLVDVPEMGISVKENGRGEVCVKGDGCTIGYFKAPEQTKGLIDSDGWYHMGDIGEWTEAGCLRIVDRCKHIFKLAQGEYIAPERIEYMFEYSELINQVFVDGKTTESYTIALILPHFDELKKHLPELASMPEEKICVAESARSLLLQELSRIGKEHHLAGYEIPHKVHLMWEPFTIENHLLTPTLKTARNAVRKHYSDVIDALYSRR